MDISIRIENLDQLKATFLKVPTIAAPLFGNAVEKIAFKIEAEAKRNAPVNKGYGGGNLRQSIQARKSGKMSAVIESKAKYSAYVDQGTRPHIIRVRNKKVLANRRTGRIFGRVVKHPGTRPTKYFSNAVESGERFINIELKSALEIVLNTIK